MQNRLTNEPTTQFIPAKADGYDDKQFLELLKTALSTEDTRTEESIKQAYECIEQIFNIEMDNQKIIGILCEHNYQYKDTLHTSALWIAGTLKDLSLFKLILTYLVKNKVPDIKIREMLFGSITNLRILNDDTQWLANLANAYKSNGIENKNELLQLILNHFNCANQLSTFESFITRTRIKDVFEILNHPNTRINIEQLHYLHCYFGSRALVECDFPSMFIKLFKSLTDSEKKEYCNLTLPLLLDSPYISISHVIQFLITLNIECSIDLSKINNISVEIKKTAIGKLLTKGADLASNSEEMEHPIFPFINYYKKNGLYKTHYDFFKSTFNTIVNSLFKKGQFRIAIQILKQIHTEFSIDVSENEHFLHNLISRCYVSMSLEPEQINAQLTSLFELNLDLTKQLTAASTDEYENILYHTAKCTSDISTFLIILNKFKTYFDRDNLKQYIIPFIHRTGMIAGQPTQSFELYFALINQVFPNDLNQEESILLNKFVKKIILLEDLYDFLCFLEKKEFFFDVFQKLLIKSTVFLDAVENDRDYIQQCSKMIQQYASQSLAQEQKIKEFYYVLLSHSPAPLALLSVLQPQLNIDVNLLNQRNQTLHQIALEKAFNLNNFEEAVSIVEKQPNMISILFKLPNNNAGNAIFHLIIGMKVENEEQQSIKSKLLKRLLNTNNPDVIKNEICFTRCCYSKDTSWVGRPLFFSEYFDLKSFEILLSFLIKQHQTPLDEIKDLLIPYPDEEGNMLSESENWLSELAKKHDEWDEQNNLSFLKIIINQFDFSTPTEINAFSNLFKQLPNHQSLEMLKNDAIKMSLNQLKSILFLIYKNDSYLYINAFIKRMESFTPDDQKHFCKIIFENEIYTYYGINNQNEKRDPLFIFFIKMSQEFSIDISDISLSDVAVLKNTLLHLIKQDNVEGAIFIYRQMKSNPNIEITALRTCLFKSERDNIFIDIINSVKTNANINNSSSNVSVPQTITEIKTQVKIITFILHDTIFNHFSREIPKNILLILDHLSSNKDIQILSSIKLNNDEPISTSIHNKIKSILRENPIIALKRYINRPKNPNTKEKKFSLFSSDFKKNVARKIIIAIKNNKPVQLDPFELKACKQPDSKLKTIIDQLPAATRKLVFSDQSQQNKPKS